MSDPQSILTFDCSSGFDWALVISNDQEGKARIRLRGSGNGICTSSVPKFGGRGRVERDVLGAVPYITRRDIRQDTVRGTARGNFKLRVKA